MDDECFDWNVYQLFISFRLAQVPFPVGFERGEIRTDGKPRPYIGLRFPASSEAEKGRRTLTILRAAAASQAMADIDLIPVDEIGPLEPHRIFLPAEKP